MPQVEIPDIGTVEFPDSMSQAEIVDAIERNILKRQPPSRSGYTQKLDAADWDDATLSALVAPDTGIPKDILEQTSKPMVSLPDLVPPPVTLMAKLGVPGAETTRNVINAMTTPIKEFAEGMTSMQGVASIPALVLAPQAVIPNMTGEMVRQLPELYSDVGKKASEGDVPGTITAAGRAALTTGMTIAGPVGMAMAKPYGEVKGRAERKADLPLGDVNGRIDRIRQEVESVAGKGAEADIYFDPNEIREVDGQPIIVASKFENGRVKINAAFADDLETLRQDIREEFGHKDIATEKGQALLDEFINERPLTDDQINQLRDSGYLPDEGESLTGYNRRLHDEFIAKQARPELGWFHEMADRLVIWAKESLKIDLTHEQAARAILRKLRKDRVVENGSSAASDQARPGVDNLSEKSETQTGESALQENAPGRVSRLFLRPSGPATGSAFRDSITAAKRDHPWGFAVDIKDQSVYDSPSTKLFVAEDGTAGVAVTQDGDLVSVFKHPKSSADIRPILAEASQHATTLDCFDANAKLPNLYGDMGFRPVARVPFNPEFAPEGWIPEKHGTPDVVLMVRDPKGITGAPEVKGSNYATVKDRVPVVDYDKAVEIQTKAKEKVRSAEQTRQSLRPKDEHTMDIEREQRAILKRVAIPQADKEKIRQASSQYGIKAGELEESARNVRARYPRSEGWNADALEIQKITHDPETGKSEIEWKGIPYSFDKDPSTGKDTAATHGKRVQKIANRMVDDVMDVLARANQGDLNAKVILRQAGWYRNMAVRLREEFGGSADMFADLLGAFSPNTDVPNNWRNAITALRETSRGTYDSILSEFDQWIASGKTADQWKKDKKPLITQPSGALFGMNSEKGMIALLDYWRMVKAGSAPKARNFALNLIGQSMKATIDVWAARALQRLSGEPVVPWHGEMAVTGKHLTSDVNKVGGQFGFGQEVFENASQQLRRTGKPEFDGVTAPDLQAMVWFLEKENWAQKGWTSKQGEGGSFELQADKMQLSRYLLGLSQERPNFKPTAQQQASFGGNLLSQVSKMAGIVGARIKDSIGWFEGKKERSFDAEFTVSPDFDPRELLDRVEEAARQKDQDAVFISRVLSPDEENLNARPGIEVYFKSKSDFESARPIIDKLVAGGQDGLTLVVDPRAKLAEFPDQFVGVRFQYVPEFSGDVNWQQKAVEIGDKLLDLAGDMREQPGVAFAKVSKYDTLVRTRDDLNTRTRTPDSEARKAAWSERANRARSEAATRRLQLNAGEERVSGVSDGGPEAQQVRESLRPAPDWVRSSLEKNKPAQGESEQAPQFAAPAAGAVSSAQAPGAATPGAPPAISQATTDANKTQTAPPEAAPAPAKTPAAPAASLADSIPDGTTGLKHAISDLERADNGFPERPATEREVMSEAWDRAGETLKQNPEAGRSLAQSLVNNPTRALTGDESALLLRHKVGIKNALDEAADKVAKATDPDTRAQAQLDVTRLSEELNTFLGAVEARGTAWGREGRWRQALASRDYSFQAQQRLLVAAKGGVPLDEAEVIALQKLVDEHKAKAEALDAEVKKWQTEAQREATERQLAQVRAEVAESSLPPAPVLDLVKRIRYSIKTAADESRAFLRGKLVSLSPEDLYHLSRIAADNLLEVGENFGKWSQRMADDLGTFAERFKPYFKEIYEAGKKHRDEVAQVASGKKAASKVKKEITKPSPTQVRANILAGLQEAKAEGLDAADLSRYVKSLVKTVVQEGEMDYDAIFNKTQQLMHDVGLDFGIDDIKQAFSNYGESAPAPTDPVRVRLGQLRAEAQKALGLKTVLEKHTPPLATGQRRVKPSDLYRRTIHQINEAMKQLGIVARDANSQLASALDARKTYLRNRIKDLRYEISTGEKIVKNKTTPLTDAEIDSLRSELEQVKREHAEQFPRSPLTEQQRIAIELKSLNREITKLEADIASGNIGKPDRPVRLSTPELEARRDRLQALRDQREEMRSLDQEFQAKRAAEELEQRKAQLLKQIDEKTAAVVSGDVGAKQSKPVNRPIHPELEPLQLQVDELNRQIHRLRNPKKTRDQIASQAVIRNANNKIAELQDRMARGDFDPKPKAEPPKLSAAAVKAQAELREIEIKFERERAKAMEQKETAVRWLLDSLARWKRTAVLSWPGIFSKLTSAAWEGIGVASVESALAGVYGKILPKDLTEGAVRYGRGTSLRIEVDTLTDTLTNLIKNFKDIVKTGNMEIDLRYGKPEIAPAHLFDWVGNLHYALKSPLMYNEWSRSFKILMRDAASKGIDVTDPAVVQKIGTMAYKYGEERLFSEPNMAVDFFRWGMRALEQKGAGSDRASLMGKIAQTILKFELPVVKIPTNIVKRTFEYNPFGGGTAAAVRIARAYRNGIEKLPAQEKDIIIRNLTRGSIGLAFFLYGWFDYENVGGYYHAGEKRRDDDVKVGGMRIGGVEIPKMLLHNPLLEQIQIGATIRRLSENYAGKGMDDVEAISSGAWAAMWGLIDETPFLGQIKRSLEAEGSPGKFFAEQLSSMVPGAVQSVAAQTDVEPDSRNIVGIGEPVKRKPKTFTERMKMTIPGLRQDVPEKAPSYAQ